MTMSIEILPRPRGSDVAAPALVARSIAVGVVVALASTVGFDVVSGPSRAGRLLPLALVAFAAVVTTAFVRFEVFVLAMLGVRATVDYLKLGPSIAVEPSIVLSVVFVLASVVWLAAQQRADRTVQRRRPLTKVALLFLGATLISTTTSMDPASSAVEWARLGSVVMMIAILERLCRAPGVMRRALVAVYLSSVVPLVVGLDQAFGGATRTVIDDYDRVNATFLHPNSFAMYLAFLIVMGVALVPSMPWHWCWAATGALGLGGTLLVLTYARGAWIAAAVGIVTVGALHGRRYVLAVVVVIAVVAVTPAVGGRFSDLDETKTESGAAPNSLAWRLDHWGEAIELARERPVTGLGPRMVATEVGDGKLAHNDYVRALAEGGVVGGIAYALLLASFIGVARKAWQRARRGLERAVANGFAGCTATLLVVSISDNVITQGVVLWYFAAFAAAASSIAYRGRDQRKTRTRPVPVEGSDVDH